MTFRFQRKSLTTVSEQTLAVFFLSDKREFSRQSSLIGKTFGSAATGLLESGDFKAKESEVTVAYVKKGAVRRLIFIGLGESKKLTLEKLRRASAAAAKKARSLKATSCGFSFPPTSLNTHDVLLAMSEGAGLGLYRFDKYLTKKDEEEPRLEAITFFSNEERVAVASTRALATASVIVEATALARDLSNAPGNEIYPETLAASARECADRNNFSTIVLDEAEIKELGMGGILGVAQGSNRPPRFIIMEYGDKKKRPVVLVGKGVTFDTGGISIKPSPNMAEMKMDMAGAAAVIGTFEAASRLKLPVHVVGLIPAVENMPSGSAIKPGDIIKHHNGKTSEVDNTDAEGRLVLADALSYAEKYKPASVIDLATLTGAVVVALGHHATGMMGTDDDLMRRLQVAGEKTYERVWQLPLFDEYEKQLKSDVADVKNVGGRWAGTITAGWFLKKFIGKYKWVHLDIAGTAILEENGDYTQRGGSGVGVRLLTEFLRTWK